MNLYQKIGGALAIAGALVLGYQKLSHAEEKKSEQLEEIQIVEKQNIAVLDFKYNTKEKPNIEDMLVTGLAKSECLSVYERSGLRKLLEEAKIGLTGAIDEETAVEIGKLAGVSKVVLGSYNSVKGKVRIDARTIDVKTGKVEYTSRVIGDENDLSLTDRLSAELDAKICGPDDDTIEEEIIQEDLIDIFGSPDYTLKDGVYTVNWRGKTLSLIGVNDCPSRNEEIVPDTSALIGFSYDPVRDEYELLRKDGRTVTLIAVEKCPEFNTEEAAEPKKPEVKPQPTPQDDNLDIQIEEDSQELKL